MLKNHPQSNLVYFLCTLLITCIPYLAKSQTITSFSPTTITSGTNSVLTINGTGFGIGPNSDNYVQFLNADDGGGSYIVPRTSDYISWTGTKIVVKVPTRASTGKIRVMTFGGYVNPLPITSATPLTVKFAILNRIGPDGVAVLDKLINHSSFAGGYRFRVHRNFIANAPAVLSFARALRSWTCATNVNFGIDLNAQDQGVLGDDGQNIIKYGDANEIEDGVLGYVKTISSRASCNGTFVVSEIDFVINKNYSWNYATALPSSSYDFETMVLHELGHAHGLAHVNNPDDVMHFARSTIGTVKRTLSSNDIEAGKYVMSYATAPAGADCFTPMIALPDSICAPALPTITSFTPTSAKAGDVVAISGTNLRGLVAVTFGSVKGTFIDIRSSTRVLATVGAGASGPVEISTLAGVATKAGFTLIPKIAQTISAPSSSARFFGDADFDPNMIASSGLPVTLVSSNSSIATIIGNKIHIVGAGSCTITASQAGNSDFDAAPNFSFNLVINKGNQTISFPSINTTDRNAPDFDPLATTNSGLAITYTTSNPSVATIVGGKVHIVGQGSVTITAVQSGNVNYNAATSVSRTFTVAGQLQTITFNALPNKLVGDADFEIGATASSGLPLTYVSSNTAVAIIVGTKIRILTDGTTTITVSQPGNATYATAPSIAQNLTVFKLTQTITFNAIPNKLMGDADFDPLATTNSGLAITYTTSDPSVATIVGGKVHIVGQGSVTITAVQSGNVNYNAAISVSKTFTVALRLQTITFNALTNKFVGDADFEIGATVTSGLPLTYVSSNPAVAIIVGTKIRILTDGTTTITVSQPGNATYAPAPSIAQNLIVSKLTQTIIFNAIPNKVMGDADFDPLATTNSGLPITYTTSDPSVATIVGGKVHIVGQGSVIIIAVQTGSVNYNAATSVSRTLTVGGQLQTINFNALPNKFVGDADFEIGATVSSGLPLTYVSSNPAVAIVVGTKIRTLRDGNTTITVSQPGNATYGPAPSIAQNLTVSKLTQTIAFNATLNKVIGDADFEIGATVSSGLMLTYTSSNPNVATIVANKVHIVGIGTSTITATQAGNATYAPATASVTLTVSQIAQTITFPAIAAKDITSADFDPLATASSGLAVSYSSSNTAVATIVAGKVHIVGAGTSTITASQAGNGTFGVATAVSVQLVVNKANQTITFPAIALKTPTDADFDLNATASSGLAPSYSSSNPAVATIVAGKVHIVGSGSAIITASQAGDANYNAAANVSQTLDVVYTLPVSNFNVKATDETCKTSNNGSINIQAAQALTYTASVTVNGGTTTYPFSNVLAINNLQAGSYNVCITVAGQPNYKQCFDLVIKEPKDLAVYSSIKDNGNSVLLTLEGSNSYRIDVNGQIITTNNQEILIPLIKGNNVVKISSDLNCQGVITKTFLTTNVIALYPNPVKNVLNITTGSDDATTAKVDIHALDGRLVHTSTQRSENGQVSVDLSKLNMGLYILTLTVGNSKTVHKIIKD